ncbi:MAG: glutamate synthase subunit beta [Sediminibacterium sp.]|nr:glutamate synthase subunit beta [Sediminibacterium sp.]
MGKVTGFKDYGRELPKKRSVSERVLDYKEFVEQYSEPVLNQQAARCMNCGIPFCHNGCPLGNLIPDFNEAVYEQKWEKAYTILKSTNNFPEFTGRVCPAPCESACVLGINQPAITIEEIEKHIIEIAFEKEYVKPHQQTVKTRFNIAVVGSGPAGLAAADQLSSVGHSVVVYERQEKPGGLLRFGIPDFKLEKSVVERRIELMKAAGIEFKCNIEVSEQMNQLEKEFDAIILACGSTIPRDLTIRGREAQGIHFAMDFLKQQNLRVSNLPIKNKPINAEGKNVIVIGGGDTGSDCIGTANRQKAASIVQFELLPLPPSVRTDIMPWPTYPMLLKNTSSHEEGAERAFSILSKEFLFDDNQQVSGIKTVQIQWQKTAEGKNIFTEIPDSEKIYPCELVLLALGFIHTQHDGLIEKLQLQIDKLGNVIASEKNYKTSREKVFVAGDMRRGQSLVVWAISEGRECARQVDYFLTGEYNLPSKEY